MPSVEVTASPECATLISVTSRYLLYVCIDTICSVTSTNPDHQRKRLASLGIVGSCRAVS